LPFYAATIVLSAFLLFVVQPIIAKQILPSFGGSAAVWTTCMVFFQSALLAGYAYSDALSRRLTLRRQVGVHATLLVMSLAALPIVVPASMNQTSGANQWGRVALLLAATVGFPYFLLSTTGPLMQAWAARHRADDQVYRLYALSNVASLSGLVLYPVVIEPTLSTRVQALLWSYGYGAFVFVAAASTALVWRRGAASSAPDRSGGSASSEIECAPPAWSRQAFVLLLAALGSILLLAVTSHMTRDVAAIPFLWLLPLLLYLLSFVICFDLRNSYRRRFWVPTTAVLVVAMLSLEVFRPRSLRLSLPLYASGLFAACMTCHGEMVARRPRPRHLTTFYLMVSMGGAIGGVLVGIVAPLTLTMNVELALALCLVAAVLYVATPGRLRFIGAAALLVASGLAAVHVKSTWAGTVALSRNFYGALRVSRAWSPSGQEVLRLSNGVILHGQQVMAGPGRRSATSYYGETSGIGRMLLALRPGNLRVGVVGLGVGTLAAYGRSGDVFRFYELDPDVARLAKSTFRYIEDSHASIEIIIGDGRLALDREPPQRFDVIVVDAFSSDAIPVHLLTREALAVYRRHLRDGGVIAFHITNRYLDLASVVRGLAESAVMRAWLFTDGPKGLGLITPSEWVLVTANTPLMERIATNGAGAEAPARNDLRLWTDDYSNLFQVVRLRSDR
jgi:SAM-dependent methyltransferase